MEQVLLKKLSGSRQLLSVKRVTVKGRFNMGYVLINNEMIDRKTNWDSEELRDCIINLSKNNKYESISQVLSVIKDVLVASGNEIKESNSGDCIFLTDEKRILEYLSTLNVMDCYTLVKLNLPLHAVEPAKARKHEC